jgi:hypothetical protein
MLRFTWGGGGICSCVPAHLCFSYGLGPRGALCSRTDGRRPRMLGLLVMVVLESAGTGRGADVTLAFGALDFRRVMSVLVVRWNFRTRPSGIHCQRALCPAAVSTAAASTLLTRRPIGLLGRAGPAGHRETALHPRAGGRLCFHYQPCNRRAGGGLADRRGGMLALRTGWLPVWLLRLVAGAALQARGLE